VKKNPVSDDVTDDEHQQRMMRSDHELDFGMMLEAKLVQVQSGPTSLRVFVRDVARSGAAQRHGIILVDVYLLFLFMITTLCAPLFCCLKYGAPERTWL